MLIMPMPTVPVLGGGGGRVSQAGRGKCTVLGGGGGGFLAAGGGRGGGGGDGGGGARGGVGDFSHLAFSAIWATGGGVSYWTCENV